MQSCLRHSLCHSLLVALLMVAAFMQTIILHQTRCSKAAEVASKVIGEGKDIPVVDVHLIHVE